MSKEDLVNLKLRSPEERIEIARKGGSIKSVKKTFSNSFKNLKHGRYARKFSLEVYNLVNDPKTFSLKICGLIERIEQNWSNFSTKQQIDLVNLYCKAYLTIHREKNNEENWSLARLMSALNEAYIQKEGHPPSIKP